MQTLALVIIPVTVGLIGFIAGSILRRMCKTTPCPITERVAKCQKEVAAMEDVSVKGSDMAVNDVAVVEGDNMV